MKKLIASGLALAAAAQVYAAPHSQVKDLRDLAARSEYIEDPLNLHGEIRSRNYASISPGGAVRYLEFIVKETGGIESIIVRETIPNEGGITVIEFTDNPEKTGADGPESKYGTLDQVEIGSQSNGQYRPKMTRVDLSQKDYLKNFREIFDKLIFAVWAQAAPSIKG